MEEINTNGTNQPQADQHERKARSDRQDFGVVVRRGKWHGWYYNRQGKRITNVPLFELDKNNRQVPIRCLRPQDDKNCPNRDKARDAIRGIAEALEKYYERKPGLREAIEEWGKHLVLQGCLENNTKVRIDQVKGSLDGVRQQGGHYPNGERPVLVQGLGWNEFDDVNRKEFRAFLSRLAVIGRSPRTRNRYLSLWRNFLDWCIEEEYISDHPMQVWENARVGAGAHTKRPFTEAELNALQASCPRERGLFYMTLALSGLRITETRLLRKNDLDPVSPRPFWLLPPQTQKIKLPATIPMMPRLAQALAQRWYCLKDDELLFPDTPSQQVFYSDIKRAGLVRKNSRGEYLTFHSFRYSFCTVMSRKLPMRLVQILMRHRAIGLTMNWYRVLHLTDLEDQWGCPDWTF